MLLITSGTCTTEVLYTQYYTHTSPTHSNPTYSVPRWRLEPQSPPRLGDGDMEIIAADGSHGLRITLPIDLTWQQASPIDVLSL